MKKALTVIFIIFALIMHTSVCYASFPNLGINQPTLEGSLVNKLGGIIGIIQMVGGGVAIGATIYLGIKYVLSSVEEKAEIKKKMIPLVIGVVIFYGATGILKLIGIIAGWFTI